MREAEGLRYPASRPGAGVAYDAVRAVPRGRERHPLYPRAVLLAFFLEGLIAQINANSGARLAHMGAQNWSASSQTRPKLALPELVRP
jgi:hypothetical protein